MGRSGEFTAELGIVDEVADGHAADHRKLCALDEVTDQDLRPRARTLSWMASMSVAAGEIRAAEGYLLELLAWCAFADREDATADATDLTVRSARATHCASTVHNLAKAIAPPGLADRS